MDEQLCHDLIASLKEDLYVSDAGLFDGLIEDGYLSSDDWEAIHALRRKKKKVTALIKCLAQNNVKDPFSAYRSLERLLGISHKHLEKNVKGILDRYEQNKTENLNLSTKEAESLEIVQSSCSSTRVAVQHDELSDVSNRRVAVENEHIDETSDVEEALNKTGCDNCRRLQTCNKRKDCSNRYRTKHKVLPEHYRYEVDNRESDQPRQFNKYEKKSCEFASQCSSRNISNRMELQPAGGQHSMHIIQEIHPRSPGSIITNIRRKIHSLTHSHNKSLPHVSDQHRDNMASNGEENEMYGPPDSVGLFSNHYIANKLSQASSSNASVNLNHNEVEKGTDEVDGYFMPEIPEGLVSSCVRSEPKQNTQNNVIGNSSKVMDGFPISDSNDRLTYILQNSDTHTLGQYPKMPTFIRGQNGPEDNQSTQNDTACDILSNHPSSCCTSENESGCIDSRNSIRHSDNEYIPCCNTFVRCDKCSKTSLCGSKEYSDFLNGTQELELPIVRPKKHLNVGNVNIISTSHSHNNIGPTDRVIHHNKDNVRNNFLQNTVVLRKEHSQNETNYCNNGKQFGQCSNNNRTEEYSKRPSASSNISVESFIYNETCLSDDNSTEIFPSPSSRKRGSSSNDSFRSSNSSNRNKSSSFRSSSSNMRYSCSSTNSSSSSRRISNSSLRSSNSSIRCSMSTNSSYSSMRCSVASISSDEKSNIECNKYCKKYSVTSSSDSETNTDITLSDLDNKEALIYDWITKNVSNFSDFADELIENGMLSGDDHIAIHTVTNESKKAAQLARRITENDQEVKNAMSFIATENTEFCGNVLDGQETIRCDVSYILPTSSQVVIKDLDNVYDQFNTMLNNGSLQIETLPENPNILCIVYYLEACNKLYAANYDTAELYITKANRELQRTDHPAQLRLEILTAQTWFLLKTNRIGKMYNLLRDHEQNMKACPDVWTSKAKGWFYFDYGRCYEAMMGQVIFINNGKVPSIGRWYNIKEQHLECLIKCAKKAVDYFQETDSSDGPIGAGFALCLMARTYLRCGRRFNTLHFKTPEIDIVHAQKALECVENQSGGISSVLKSTYLCCKCDLSYRKGHLKEAKAMAVESLELSSKLDLKEETIIAKSRVDILETIATNPSRFQYKQLTPMADYSDESYSDSC